MRRVFADAAYFIALLLPTDDLARSARAVDQALTGITLVTSEAVLYEYLAHVSRMGPVARSTAVETVRRLLARDDVVVVRQDQDLFDRALDLYAARLDKEYSLAH